MKPLSLAAEILSVLEEGTTRGDQIVDLTRVRMALEGALRLPTLADFKATVFTLRYTHLIECPHAEQPVWSPRCVYRLTDQGRTMLQRQQVNEMMDNA